jgi:hypothetical protein
MNAIDRAKRAHERRWGQSVLPLVAKRMPHPRYPFPLIVIIDRENGAQTVWDASCRRIKRVSEIEPNL